MRVNARSVKLLLHGPVIGLALLGSGCGTPKRPDPVVPAVETAKRIREQYVSGRSLERRGIAYDERARLRYAVDGGAPDAELPGSYEALDAEDGEAGRDYNGPLSLGDPGLSASLWHESRDGNDMFRDDRAWRPLDLITIRISEASEGSKEADTEVKSKSSAEAAIEHLLGLETQIAGLDKAVDPTALVTASAQNDFKGEGQTSRKGKLTATVSAMVVEVLPSGTLRIEGQKIIAVNNEEQVIVISGLVRPRDVDSTNTIDSSKIADMRIDYYGRGSVGEAQYGGWLGRIMRYVWPF